MASCPFDSMSCSSEEIVLLHGLGLCSGCLQISQKSLVHILEGVDLLTDGCVSHSRAVITVALGVYLGAHNKRHVLLVQLVHR